MGSATKDQDGAADMWANQPRGKASGLGAVWAGWKAMAGARARCTLVLQASSRVVELLPVWRGGAIPATVDTVGLEVLNPNPWTLSW